MNNLKERVSQFMMMEMPGQPRMMHMGTVYLVNDLMEEVENLRDDLKRTVHCIKVILDHAEGDERLEVSLHLDIARQIVDEIESEINN